MDAPHDPAYDVRPVRTARLSGAALRLVTKLLERPAIAAFAAPWLTRNIGIRELRLATIDEPPTFLPLHPNLASSYRAQEANEVPRPAGRGMGGRFHSVSDFASAYRNGIVTPEQVAERVLEGIDASDRQPRPIRAFIACNRRDVLAQAHRSALRYRTGQPLGPLDGVPVAVKDEVDMVPYPTTAGTRFLGRSPARADSAVVGRLRQAGALLIGKTNMHEIGILPDGFNPHHGVVRNPYNPAHEAGGSSGGSAAAVAAGLCPAAIGADGGGSIRIPAADCGVVGLKPTFGRVSERGAVPLAWSVAHLGPMAATAADAAVLYAAMAGPDPTDPNTQLQPPVRIGGYEQGLRGVRIGVYRDWFTDADAGVVACCERLLSQFVLAGAELIDIVIPELRMAATAHGLIIHAEMAAAMDRYDSRSRRDLGWTTRLMLANIRAMRPSDYVLAQRVRTRAIRRFLSALAEADVIATPTTPITAPAVREGAGAEGEADLGRVIERIRFVSPANLTGLPAISVPAGYDLRGLPAGLQLIGRPWDEHMLFRLALAADAVVERREPAVSFDLLPELGA